MSEKHEYTPNQQTHLINILVRNNPADRCQQVVRQTAWLALIGEKQLHPHGLFYLSNGAAGYDLKMLMPEDFEDRLLEEAEVLEQRGIDPELLKRMRSK